MLFSVPRPQGEEAEQGQSCHTHSVPLTARHAALDVVVILLEELVIGHL